ncbi:hypothetical protein PG994_009938 [Apiospora phragmitis]|uniref:Uncharacterized protein n=1 Tax=Apiospora phragmitis TaxID=2905665 RepID=A0ABR1TNG5_9PEZI
MPRQNSESILMSPNRNCEKDWIRRRAHFRVLIKSPIQTLASSESRDEIAMVICAWNNEEKAIWLHGGQKMAVC